MGNFKEFFEHKLTVGQYPYPADIEEMDADIVINVSNEYQAEEKMSCQAKNIDFHWFPMTESNDDMGINSIFAALQIMYLAEMKSQKVYLHCHAGVNRSPTVADCYYYMRSGQHRERNEKKVIAKGKNYFLQKNNRLIENCQQGHLPGIKKMEHFLRLCKESFETDSKGLEWCRVGAKV